MLEVYPNRFRVKFAQLPWSHPIRRRWRGMGNADPVVSLHERYYAFHETWRSIRMMVVGVPIVIAFLAMVGNFVFPPLELSLWVCLEAVVIAELVLAAVLAHTTYYRVLPHHMRDAAVRFSAEVDTLEENLGMFHEQLVGSCLQRIELAARLALCDQAFKILCIEAERRTAEHEPAKDVFRKMYDQFSSWELVAKTGFGQYFRQAQLDPEADHLP